MLQIKNLRENIEVAIVNIQKIEWEKIDIVKIKFKGRVFDFTIPKLILLQMDLLFQIAEYEH